MICGWLELNASGANGENAMPVPNPAHDVSIAQRVFYVDNDGKRHRAIIVDDCPGDPYVTLVWGGEQGELGDEYHSQVETETSVYMHELFDEENGGREHVFFPYYWSYEGEHEPVEEVA